MSSPPAIQKITYRRGLVTGPTDWQGLKTVVLEGPRLSKAIVEAVLDNDLLSAGGVHGIPDIGDPVEFDWLQIYHAQGTTEIKVYNRGIMLLMTNNKLIKRIHRVCCVIENQVKFLPP
jgi:hypothetical protein